MPKEAPPPSGEAGPPNPVALWIAVFLVFAAVVVGIVFAVKHHRERPRRARPRLPSVPVASSRVSVLSGLAQLVRRTVEKLHRALLSLWRLLRIRWRRRAVEDESVISVRALYRRLLAWAAGRGLPRTPSQTPLEYLGVLAEAWPQERGDLAVLTEAYLQSRYGRNPSSQDVLEAARRAWQHMKSP